MAIAWRLGLAILLGFAAFYVLAPLSGAGGRCYEWPLGMEVPCGIEFAVVTGVAAGVLVALGLLLANRRRVT
jgi:hypothetical protein